MKKNYKFVSSGLIITLLAIMLPIKTETFVTLNKLGPKVEVRVRQSTRAKHIAIRINYNIAELILPNKNIDAGYKFLLKKEAWIRKKLQATEAYSKIESNSLPIWDEEHSLEYIDSVTSRVVIKDLAIHVYSLPLQQYHNLTKFLHYTLLEEVTALANSISKEYKINFTKIRIMNNKSKWGSCSSKGVLSFNWKLIFAPKEVVRYLVVHEICHIREMNHSKRFWSLVEHIYPNHKSSKLWLKQNTARLEAIATAIFKPKSCVAA